MSPHDRIGLYLADSPGSVAYDFVSGNPTTLRKEVDPPSELNDVLIFDTLQWPYKFSVAAYVDTGEYKYHYINKNTKQIHVLSRKEQTLKSVNQVSQSPREKDKIVKKVKAKQKCEPSKKCEISCWRSKHLLHGMPHASHITWCLIGQKK